MVLDWFFTREFEEFYKRVERIEKATRIFEKKTGKKRFLDVYDYAEVYKHFKKIENLMPQLENLFEDEKKKIMQLEEKSGHSEFIPRLKVFTRDLGTRLEEIKNRIESGKTLIEEILRTRKLSLLKKESGKIHKNIKDLVKILINIETDARKISRLETKFKEKIKKSKGVVPVRKINLPGRLRNGWPLRNVQNVVVDLGGRVVPNKGVHPYKIIFEEKRPVPLAASTPPLLLVKELSERTGVPKKDIFRSISRGELIN